MNEIDVCVVNYDLLLVSCWVGNVVLHSFPFGCNSVSWLRALCCLHPHLVLSTIIQNIGSGCLIAPRNCVRMGQSGRTLNSPFPTFREKQAAFFILIFTTVVHSGYGQVISVSTGGLQTCALMGSNGIRCFGAGGEGEPIFLAVSIRILLLYCENVRMMQRD